MGPKAGRLAICFSPGSFLFPFLELFGNKKERPQLVEQRVPRRGSKRLTGPSRGVGAERDDFFFLFFLRKQRCPKALFFFFFEK